MVTEKKPRVTKPKAPKVKELTVRESLAWALKASTKKQETPAFAHVFFSHGQVRCSNGLIAMGAPVGSKVGEQAIKAIILAETLKAAMKASGKAAIELERRGDGIKFSAGGFAQELAGVNDLEFPYEDPAGTESVPDFNIMPGLKEALIFPLDKAPESKEFLCDVLIRPDGVIIASDGDVIHNAWAGGALYGSTVALSQAFVKVLVKEKTSPEKWFATANSITAVWGDGRWLQGPSNNGAVFERNIEIKRVWENFSAAQWTPVPENLKEAAAAIIATAESGSSMCFYDGAGKLWTLITEDGPSVEIVMGSQRLCVDAKLLQKIAGVATEWSLTADPGLCYYRGTSCRGVFRASKYEKVLPKTDDAPELGEGLLDENENEGE